MTHHNQTKELTTWFLSGFIDNYFIWSMHGETQPSTESIIDEREEEKMNVDHVYSHHDDGGDQDDLGPNNKGLDVECCIYCVATI
jgi:hypothetical protein